ncbi:unnamed protein product [Hapterophycus canaliculatus]
MALATVMKLRQALLERSAEIYARRHARAPIELAVAGEELSSERLKLVSAEVFGELGNMDQKRVPHDMPVETTLEKRGAKDARIATGGDALASAT